MTAELIFEIIGTLAGWAAIILGLAWVAGRFSRREIYIIQTGGNDGGGRRPDPAPDPFPRRHNRRVTARRVAK